MAESGAVGLGPTDGYVVVDTPRRRWGSPLTRRRWANFKANRRAYLSLWTIGTMVVVSLFAEVIANDKPIVMGFGGELLRAGAVRLSGNRVRRGVRDGGRLHLPGGAGT